MVWHFAIMPKIAFACLLVATAACNEIQTGTSFGRPPAAAVDRPELAPPLRIAEIYVADPDPATHFAELMVDETETTIDLATVELCAGDTCIPAACDGTEVAGTERVVCALGGLTLAAAAGEVAVVDDDQLLAYLAWGGESGLFGSSWSAAALLSGAIEPGEFIPLPFPMPQGVAVSNELGDAGCAAPSSGSPGTTDAGLCPESSTPQLFISEILPAGSDTAASWIELENTGDEDVELAWVRLCQVPSCVVFLPGETLAAHARLLVHLGRSGSNDASNRYFADAIPVRPSGEIVLLAPGDTDLAGDPSSLQSFLRSGPASATDMASQAVDAGLWSEAEGVIDSARAPRVAGESLSRNPGAALSASAWHPAVPTPLAENPEISEATNQWQSCSFPRPWQAQPAPDLVVEWVSRVAEVDGVAIPEQIVVLNQASAAVDLSTVTLELDGIARDLLDATPSAVADSNESEALVRVSDTGVDEDDFERGAATPGEASVADCDDLVISELVLDPQQDWNDSTDAGEPFDATPGSGDVDTNDQWIEILNCTSGTIDLSGYRLEFLDSWSSEVLISDAATDMAGEIDLKPGQTLVVGNLDRRVGVDVEVEILLRSPTLTVVDRVLVGVTSLGAGERVHVELRADEVDCDPKRLCWRDAPGISSSGEINLLDSGVLLQHLPWGGEAEARTGDAVAAGLWPLETCSLPVLELATAFSLSNEGVGPGSGDYDSIPFTEE
jgi:hypothetical protein